MLSYGAAALVHSVSSDIISAFGDTYCEKDVHYIMAIASLKAINPYFSLYRQGRDYNMSYLKIYYPGLSLIENDTSQFLQRLERDDEKRLLFCNKLTKRAVSDYNVAVYTDTAVNSPFADGKISVLCAYDLKSMDLIRMGFFTCEAYPESLPSFISDGDIKDAIIIPVYGSLSDTLKKKLGKYQNVHYLTPTETDDNLPNCKSRLNEINENILYNKYTAPDGLFRYCFKTYVPDYLQKNLNVALLDSDMDLDPLFVYRLIEELYALNDIICLGIKNESSEFLDFIASILKFRMIKKIRKCRTLDDMSYESAISELEIAWRFADAPPKPFSDDKYWIHTSDELFAELEELGLSEPANKKKPAAPKQEKLKRKRGRPKKSTSCNE